MKNRLTLLLFLLLHLSILSCKKVSTINTEGPISENNLELYFSTPKIDSVTVNQVLGVSDLRYQRIENGYVFNLPFTYSISYIPKFKNTKGNSYIFKWGVNDHFQIDSESEGFKRFSVSNFIDYIPFSAKEEGEIYIVASNNSPKLEISDFIKASDEVFYMDENSTIFKIQGKIRALYFEYLTDTDEYLVYLSNTPFWNIQPNPKEEDIFNQLLHQLRFAKNISKPIIKQTKDLKVLSNQLSNLEKTFLCKLVSGTNKTFSEDLELQYFIVKDQGNRGYFTVFRTNTEIELLWKKLNKVDTNQMLTIGDTDTEFDYLYGTKINYFYHNSDYVLISKNEFSLVYKKKSSESFCLIIKPKNSDMVIMKVFPELMGITPDYYKNEIEFYKVLFENYKDLESHLCREIM